MNLVWRPGRKGLGARNLRIPLSRGVGKDVLEASNVVVQSGAWSIPIVVLQLIRWHLELQGSFLHPKIDREVTVGRSIGYRVKLHETFAACFALHGVRKHATSVIFPNHSELATHDLARVRIVRIDGTQ